MTDHDTLLGLLGKWVTVTHPGDPQRVWQGRLASLFNSSTLVLHLPDGGTEVLPQSFDVQVAVPAAEGLHPGTDDHARPFGELVDAGLLWLINRTALHPRGLALTLHVDGDRRAYGWSLVRNHDGEPWHFDPATDAEGFRHAEETIADAFRDGPPTAPLARCCVCGGGPVTYGNHSGMPFCAGCATCECGLDPCARQRLGAETGPVCTATATDPFHGLARCTKHYPEARDGYQHEGTAQDGSLLRWNDGEPDTTLHSPDASGPDVRTVEDDRPDMVGAIQTPSIPDGNEYGVTCPDAVRTNPDADVSAPSETGPDVRTVNREAIADAFDVPAAFTEPYRCSCGQTGPLLHIAPDGAHWHVPPAEYEKLQRGRDDVHPVIAAWGNCWDRAENLRQRLELARQVLVQDGFFTDDQIGDDLAPRLTEWVGVHRARIRELADALAEALSHYTVPAEIDGQPALRTGYIEARQVERWRKTLGSFRQRPYTPQPDVHGRCPACGSDSLRLDAGHVTCARLECDDRHAASTLLDAHPNAGPECRRDHCAATRQDLVRAVRAFEVVRSNAISAAKYIGQQQLARFPFGDGHNRWRVLETLGAYAGDPGRPHLTTIKEEDVST